MAQHPTRRQRIKRAKKKITELVDQGVRINIKKASEFTVRAVGGIPAKTEMLRRAMSTSAGTTKSGKFDNTVQLASRKKSSGHR